jgi:hypothetical protein
MLLPPEQKNVESVEKEICRVVARDWRRDNPTLLWNDGTARQTAGPPAQ